MPQRNHWFPDGPLDPLALQQQMVRELNAAGGFDRSSWMAKSSAAQQSEDQAKRTFDQHRREVESNGHTAKVSHELLNPTFHLTQPCFKTFREYVKQFPGWNTVRRAANPRERAEHQITKRHVVYFTITRFDPTLCPSAAEPKQAVPLQQAAAAAAGMQPLAARSANINVDKSTADTQKRKTAPGEHADELSQPSSKKQLASTHWSR